MSTVSAFVRDWSPITVIAVDPSNPPLPVPIPIDPRMPDADGSPPIRRVHALDPITINQIAAGEVVERPASVVKELVENALDAGATRIEVELAESGRRLIRVRDDGIGMSEADAGSSLLRHATSKIRSVDDLASVATLGFRGEAIPSIASVSRFSIATATADGRRLVVEVEGGVETARRWEAGPRGTEVTVAELFFNVPARRKFLRSDTTELGQILDHASRYAIAYPHVAFRVEHQGQVALDSPGRGDPLEAVAAAWSRELARSLVPIDAHLAGMHLRGFVSPPHVTKTTRGYQYLYVNGRPVRSRSLTAAIDVAFREITPERRFPLLVLMIDIDPALVDVNVSPTKSEVRFQREGAVFDAIRHSIKQALVAHGMMPDVRQVATLNSFVRENAGYRPGTGMGMGVPVPTGLGAGALGSSWLGAGKGEGLGQGQGSGEGLGTGGLGRDRSAPADEAGPSGGFAFLGLEVPAATSDRTVGEDGSRTSDGAFLSAPSSSPNSPTDGEPMAAEPSFADFLLSLRVIGQAMKLVILAESPALTMADGARRPAALVMIDQHAAHERILWEKLCGERGRAQIERQHLLVPVTVELDRRAAILLRDRLPEIQEIGFEVEPFGGSADGGASFIIRAIPAAIGSKDPARIFRDLADELVESAVQRRLVPTRELIWITTACRMAIKAGDALSMAEMEELIRQLADCENPYLCPHGRPIVVRLDREATARLFKR
jgi:DNA mismatch repair protein MutL